jgi:hypothetical protein
MTKPHRDTPFCTEDLGACVQTSLADGLDLARQEKGVKSLDIRLIWIDSSVRSGFRMNSGSLFALTQETLALAYGLFSATSWRCSWHCVGNRT